MTGALELVLLVLIVMFVPLALNEVLKSYQDKENDE